MNFQALLFCQDEKTARITTQLLNELEFSVETCTEPFAAVKKLMGQHFDAVVVDCDNEQNASLLFKGARNSQLNQSSLAVAVVEGQAGVANAFRIGANLVLTKPINIEQAKGTLRVARGLLKKGGETAKAPVSPAPAASKPSVTTTPSPAAPKMPAAAPVSRAAVPPEAFSKPVIPAAPARAVPVPAMAKPSSDNVLGLNADAANSAEEILLDVDTSSAVSSAKIERKPEAKAQAKPEPKPELKTGLKPASLLEAQQSLDKLAPQRSPIPPVSSAGAAAAPAPAKVVDFEKIGDTAPDPNRLATPAVASSSRSATAPGLFAQPQSAPTFGSLESSEEEKSGSQGRFAIIAIVVLALAAAGYFGFTKLHKAASGPAPAAQQQMPLSTPEPSTTVTSTPASPAVQEPIDKPGISHKPSPIEPQQSTAHKSETAKAETTKNTESGKKSDAEPEVVVRNMQPEPLVVKSNPSQAKAAAQAKEAEVEAPSLVGAAPGDSSALSSIVTSAPKGVPSSVAAPEMLKVSQGVTQGLLLKRVQPVYPHAATQMRISGAVQLLAVISKSGNVTSIKVLSGDPILARAAVDAVAQWKYKPYTLDGAPVDIQTQITVNFRLP